MSGENVVSDKAEAALRLLVERFAVELANQRIGSASVKFESTEAALLAMMRLGYLEGVKDGDAAARLDELQKLTAIGQAVLDEDRSVFPQAGAGMTVREAIAARLEELSADPFEADLARMNKANRRG